MESLISTFHIDWKIMVAQLVNFGIVVIVLYFFALKPLKKLMRDRTETIQTGIQDAETNKKLLAETKSDYDKALAEARKEAQNIITTVTKEAEAKRAEMIEKAKQESDNIIEQGKKTLEAEKIKMLDDAKKELVALIINTTEKVLGDTVTAPVEAGLVEKRLKELS